MSRVPRIPTCFFIAVFTADKFSNMKDHVKSESMDNSHPIGLEVPSSPRTPTSVSKRSNFSILNFNLDSSSCMVGSSSSDALNRNRNVVFHNSTKILSTSPVKDNNEDQKNDKNTSKHIETINHVPVLGDGTAYYNYAEIVGKSNLAINVLLNEKLAASAVDSIRDSQLMANSLAKSLLIDTFNHPSSPALLGEFLKYLFASESVLLSTREFLYWAIHSTDGFNSTLQLTKWQSKYWMKDPIAKVYTLTMLMDTSISWLHDPSSRTTVINPLLSWTVSQHEISVKPLAQVVVSSLPYSKESVAGGLKYQVIEALKSEHFRKVAKEGMIFYLKAAADAKDSKIDKSASTSALQDVELSNLQNVEPTKCR